MTHNLAQCRSLIRKASSAGASVLFLPEASDYIGSNASETISLCQPITTSPFVLGLQKEAAHHRLPINVGIHEPASANASSSTSDSPDSPESTKKVQNTLIWIDASGTITHRYQKLHLFDVEIRDGPILKESNSVRKGPCLIDPFPTPLGQLGLLICFDLRFPEPSLALRNRGAQILTYPSAFTVPTGKAHWEVLLRARAIETQSYVVAAAQVGCHDGEGGKRRSYGHGMIVDPWGRVVAELGGEGEEEGSGKGLDVGEIAVAEVDLEGLERVRREMPLLRRTDVYPEIL
jgi:predicted amidohydrolase